jgi:hypothetical protein
VVLLLQIVAGFRLLCMPRAVADGAWRVCCPPDLWPFLDYNMYDRAWYPGRDFPWYVLVGIEADGRETVITAADMGVEFERWRRWGVSAFLRGDAEGVQPFVDGLSDPAAFVSLRLEDHRRVLGEDGSLQVEPPSPRRKLSVVDGVVQR